MEASIQKVKRRTVLASDESAGAGFKSPFKLLSPIFHTKTIYLHDWWLMRREGGDGIAVGGFTIRREGVETSFCSALIKERHDSSILESSDGITIFICCPINRSVTEQNGFPPEVCSHFLNGFPYNWDDFSSQHVREGSTHVDSRTGSPNGSHTFPPGSFQDMSCLQKRDLLLSAHGLYEEDAISEHISNDLLAKLKSAVASNSKELHEKGVCPSLNLNGVRTRRMAKQLMSETIHIS